MDEESLKQISWFSQVGKVVSGVVGFSDWQEWPGPEDPTVEPIHLRQQDMLDELTRDEPTVENTFVVVRDAVIRLASAAVAYDPETDAWDPASFAVWHAAWTAGLVAAFNRLGRTVPPELEKQWSWFCRGHWPAAVATFSESGEPSQFRVL